MLHHYFSEGNFVGALKLPGQDFKMAPPKELNC